VAFWLKDIGVKCWWNWPQVASNLKIALEIVLTLWVTSLKNVTCDFFYWILIWTLCFRETQFENKNKFRICKSEIVKEKSNFQYLLELIYYCDINNKLFMFIPIQFSKSKLNKSNFGFQKKIWKERACAWKADSKYN